MYLRLVSGELRYPYVLVSARDWSFRVSWDDLNFSQSLMGRSELSQTPIYCTFVLMRWKECISLLRYSAPEDLAHVLKIYSVKLQPDGCAKIYPKSFEILICLFHYYYSDITTICSPCWLKIKNSPRFSSNTWGISMSVIFFYIRLLIYFWQILNKIDSKLILK